MKSLFLLLLRKNIFIFFLSVIGLYQVSYAQMKVGKTFTRVKPNVLLDLDDPNKALLLNRVKNPVAVIGTNAYPGMIVYDSSVNKLAYYNGTSWIYPSESINSNNNILMKKFNPNFDDIAVVDSIGRLMKVDILDLLNPSFPPIGDQSNFAWTPNVPFWIANLNRHTYGMWKTPRYERNPDAWVRTTNFIGAKDSIVIKIDVYPGKNTGLTGGFYLRLFQYADALGTLIKVDTVVTIVDGNDKMGTGISYLLMWNRDVSYPVKLNPNTKFIKIDFLSSAYDDNAEYGGRFFDNISIRSISKPKTLLLFAQGGNSFGAKAILGTKDTNSLSIITNNIERVAINDKATTIKGFLTLSNLTSGTIADSILTINTATGIVRRIAPSTIKPSVDTSIYNLNGTLSGNRVVTMGGNSLTFNSTAGNFIFNSTSTSNFILNSTGTGNFIFNPTGTGKVGIGTTTPAQLLDIQKSGTDNYIRIQAGATATNSSGILLNEHNNDYGWRMRFDANTDNLYFEPVSGATIDTVVVFQKSNGNVGIGTTAPTDKLDVAGTSMFRNNMQVNGIITAEKINLTNAESGNVTDRILVLGSDKYIRTINAITSTNIYNSDGTLTSDRNVNMGGKSLYFTNGGNVGIGTTTPGYKLDVSGDIKGNILYASQIQGISDAQLKQEISPIQGALAKVLQLQGVTYTWRKNMEKQAGYTFKAGRDYGVIAQEIQKILPELVQQDAKGFLTVDYLHITPILVEAIKEQQTQIQALKNEIQELKMMMKQIQQSINIK